MTRSPLFRGRALTAASALVLASLALGCGLSRARKALDEGRYLEAAAAYREVLQKDPANVKARIGYRAAAIRAAEDCIARAKDHLQRGKEAEAYAEARQALAFDPNQGLALEMLAELERRNSERKSQEQRSMEALHAEVEAEDTLKLNPRTAEGMNVNFSKKQSLKDLLANLGQAFGISILFHSSYQDVQIQADLRGLTFQRMLDTLMLQSDLFYRVQGANTIMVFKSSPTNRQQYESQLTKTFFLSNGEINDVKNVLQTLMQDARIFTDKRTNALIVKAKPTDMAIATRIVQTLDKAKPEVMVYLELLEVTENSMEQVGLVPVVSPQDALGGGSGMYRTGIITNLRDNAGLNINDGGVRITRSDLRFLLPSLAIDALKSSGDAKLVASPNVRCLSGEQGEVVIGQKVSTTQSALGGMSGGASQIPGGGNLGNLAGMGGYPMGQTQFGYEDIGVKIKVEPRVHSDRTVTLKIDASVTSQISGSTPGRPDIGQRNVKTFARLQDGETAVFAGLLKEDEQKSLQGIWGLSDIPVIGKLLGNSYKKRSKTDVILTVRSVLVRAPEISRQDIEAFDPERGVSDAGPFAPTKAVKAEPQVKPATPKPEAPKPEAPKPEAPKPVTPEAPKPVTPEAPKPEAPKPEPLKPADPPKVEEPKADAKPAVERPADANLIVFLSPLSTSAQKGERVQFSLLVSGGKGITSGSFDMMVDDRLKLLTLQAGDFLTQEGGSIEHKAGGNVRTTKVNFKRTGAQSESGTLALIEFEVVGAAGNAPVLLMESRYLVGSNPVPAKVMNALVSVE